MAGVTGTNEKPFPGLWQAVGEMTKLLIALYAGVVVAMALTGPLHVTQTAREQAAYSLGALGAYAIVLASAVRLRQLNPRSAFSLGRPNGKVWFGVPLVVAGLNILLSEFDNCLRFFLDAVPQRTITAASLVPGSADFLIIALATVLVAPVAEEFFFRGMLLNGFSRRYPRRLAIATSALFFAWLHLILSQDVFQFGWAFAFGIALAWMVQGTGSIWPAVATHALNNALQLVTAAQTKLQIRGFNALSGSIAFQPLWFDLLGLVLLVAGAFVFLVSTGRLREEDSPRLRL